MDSAESAAAASRRSGLVRVFLLLFLGLGIFSPLFSQEEAPPPLEVREFLQSDPVVEGTRFNVYLEIPREYLGKLRFIPPADGDRIRRYSGPSYILSSDDIEIAADHFLARYNFMPDVAGYTTLGSFTLVSGTNRIETPEMLIPITADGEMVPPELEWNLPEDSVYEGQTVFISLDMHRAKEVVFPETLSIDSARDGILEEVTGLGDLTTYEYAGETFNRIPLATFLYTPLKSGELPIPAAQVRFGDYRRRIRAQSITVKPLPAGMNPESGAVGDFTVTSTEPPGSMDEGAELVFELSVKGQGNLSVLQIPDIDVVNATIEGRDQEGDYVPTENGYEGVQTKVYRIRPDNYGSMQIIVPAFSWFNPKTENLEQAPKRIYNIEVKQKDDSADRQPRFDEMKMPAVGGIAAIFPLNLSSSLWGVLLFASIPLYLFLYLSIRRHWYGRNRAGFNIFLVISLLGALYVGLNMRDNPGTTLEVAGFTEWSAGQTAEQAVEKGRELEATHPRDVKFLFTLAQLEYTQGNKARSVYLMRKAVGYQPMNSFLRDALSVLEQELDLHRQFVIARVLHGDWAFLMVYVCLLLAAVVLSSLDFTPRWNASFVVSAVLFFVIFATGVSMYISYYRNAENQMAVIVEGGDRKSVV